MPAGDPAYKQATLDDLVENRAVRPYERLVDRVDRDKIDGMIRASRASFGEAEDVEVPLLTLDAVVDCELQTMRLVEAEPVQESDRLVTLTLESQGERRTVVAGLGHEAAKGDLVGKTLLLLANLEPKVLRGRESHGMILAAEVDAVSVPVVVSDSQANANVE
jgi:methionyl-tRNA synthetase